MKFTGSPRRAHLTALLLVLVILFGAPASQAALISWGPFRLDVGVQAEFEWTDNANNSEFDQVTDMYIRAGPVLSGGVILPAYFSGGQSIVLSVSMSLELEYSLLNNTLDNNSNFPINLGVSIPFYVLGWNVIAYDNFNYTNDSLDSNFGYNAAEIGQFTNIAGFTISRFFHRFGLTFDISRTDEWYPDDPFEDNIQYSFGVTPSIRLRDNYSVFWSNKYGITYMEDPERRDATGFETNIGVQGIITPNLSGSVGAGWAWTWLEETHLLPSESISGPSVNMALNYANALRPNTSYSISVHYTPGATAILKDADATSTLIVSLSLAHRLNRWLTLAPVFSWERSVDVDAGPPPNERATTYRVGISLNRQFGTHLSAYITYEFESRQSDIRGQSYDVNMARIGATYMF